MAAPGASRAPAPPDPTPRSWPRPEDAVPARPVAQWIILVSRDQPDLFAHLTLSFAGDDKVDVVLDQANLAAAHQAIEERLRLRGVAVLKRHPR